MTSRFWTICAIPFLPMGAAAVVLLMTLLGEHAAEKPEHRTVVVLAQSFHSFPRSRTRTTRHSRDVRAHPSVGKRTQLAV
jgi:hypothetical protein